MAVQTMDPIPLEDLALLDVLQQISQASESVLVAAEIKKRLMESALVEDDDEGVRLTHAGIALCKSLQHRVAADKLASEIIDKREGASGGIELLPGERSLTGSTTTV